jgi:hypothetical protein
MTNLLLHFSKSEIDDLLVLERGEGPYVFDTGGKRYIDALSSLFCAQIGYSHGEEMAAAASRQLTTLAFNTTGARRTRRRSSSPSGWPRRRPATWTACSSPAAARSRSRRRGSFTIGGGFAPLGGGAVLGALASGGIFFAYSGLWQILDFGGEVVNPQRNIPIAIVIGGIIIPLVIYMMLEVGFIGAVDWSSAGVHVGDWVD